MAEGQTASKASTTFPDLAIGLMSGTSGDGIDAALVRFAHKPDGHLFPSVELVESLYVPYTKEQRDEIFQLFAPDVPARVVAQMDARMGHWFGQTAAMLMNKARVSAPEVAIIGSHGQTVYHAPELGVSLQIGDAAVIAHYTGCPVVSAFRRGDIAHGGQGAPLVPYFDYACLASSDITKVILNIGGISNITVLPQGGTLDDVIAFDTGPGNMLIDALVNQLTMGQVSYDKDGALALEGTPNQELVEMWLQGDDYLLRHPPKSTGRERYGVEFLPHYQEQMTNQSMVDQVATMTLFVARSIANGIRMVLKPPFELMIGGGGRHNQTLVRWIDEWAKPERVTHPDEQGIPTDMKEAMAFALLAWEFIHGRPTNVTSATGAGSPVVLGQFTPRPLSG